MPRLKAKSFLVAAAFAALPTITSAEPSPESVQKCQERIVIPGQPSPEVRKQDIQQCAQVLDQIQKQYPSHPTHPTFTPTGPAYRL
jgi:hypothetical protein